MIWLRKILWNSLFLVEHNLSLHYLQIILTISFLLLYFCPIFPLLLQVVRMYRTLLGEAGFKKGMVLYFERHDGGAVTCDDFRAAMAGMLSSYLMLPPSLLTPVLFPFPNFLHFLQTHFELSRSIHLRWFSLCYNSSILHASFYLSVCYQSVYLSMHLSSGLYALLILPHSISLSLSLHLSLYLPLSLSLSLSLSPSLSLSLYLPLSISLSLYLTPSLSLSLTLSFPHTFNAI